MRIMKIITGLGPGWNNIIFKALLNKYPNFSTYSKVIKTMHMEKDTPIGTNALGIEVGHKRMERLICDEGPVLIIISCFYNDYSDELFVLV